jgi:hypothetical protein
MRSCRVAVVVDAGVLVLRAQTSAVPASPPLVHLSPHIGLHVRNIADSHGDNHAPPIEKRDF